MAAPLVAALVVLLALWIHTQRVPGANTHPPRPIWIGVTLALLVLSLVRPALSGPAADLATAPTTIPLDWFYLAVYPLLYAWSPGGMWALIGALGSIGMIGGGSDDQLEKIQ